MSIQTQHAAGTVSWVDLTTSKPEETRQFYSRLFGWTFEDQGPDYGHYHWVRKDGHVVAGFMPNSPEMSGVPSVWTVYYASDDAQADAARIRELGGQVMVEPMEVHGLGHMLVAADPTGAVFGLWQPLAFQGSELVNEHGSMAWQEVGTRSPDRACAFYTTLFGARSEPLPGVSYHVLKKGELDIGGVFDMEGHSSPDDLAHWMPYFAVNDVQEAVTVAAASGGAVSVPPFGTPYGPVAVLTDPAGAVFTVVQLSTSAE